MILAGQNATFSADESALGGRKPFMYRFDFGDGTVGDAIADEGIRNLREINNTGGTFTSLNAAE